MRMSSASREASALIAWASRAAWARISSASLCATARISEASSSASRSIAEARPPRPAYDGLLTSSSWVSSVSSADSSVPALRVSCWAIALWSAARSAASCCRRWSTAGAS